MNYNELVALTKSDKTIWRPYAEVMRPNGIVETIDLSKRFFGMTRDLAKKIKEDTAKAGRGDVIRIWRKEVKTNANALERKWNDLYNEGEEGYIPDVTNDARFRAEIVTVDFL